MTIEPIAYFHSPFSSKFGIPRQSGVVKSLRGEIRFTSPFNKEEAIRGMESYDRLWLIWEFNGNGESDSLLVRPPRLGGNEKVGVFASRSPFRPNRLGLSCVKIEQITKDSEGIRIVVSGADLMDNTPIYDIKPYVAYADSHPDSKSGFVDVKEWNTLDVELSQDIINSVKGLDSDDFIAIKETLSQDPRPKYHDNPQRIYGMEYKGHDIRFKVTNNTLTIVEII